MKNSWALAFIALGLCFNSFAQDTDKKIFFDHLKRNRYKDAELMLVGGGKWIDNEVVTGTIRDLCVADHDGRCSSRTSVLYQLTTQLIRSFPTTSIRIEDIPRALARIARINIDYLKQFEALGVDVTAYFPSEGISWDYVSGVYMDDDAVKAAPLSLLEVAALTGNIEVIRHLVQKGAPLGNTQTNVFYRAMSNRYYGCFLSSYGTAQIDDEFFVAIGNVPESILNSVPTKRAFVDAVLTRDFYFAKRLLQLGFKPGQEALPFMEFRHHDMTAGTSFDPSKNTLFSLQVIWSYETHLSENMFDYLNGGLSCGRVRESDPESYYPCDRNGNVIPIEIDEGARPELADLLIYILENRVYTPTSEEVTRAKKYIERALTYPAHSSNLKSKLQAILRLI